MTVLLVLLIQSRAFESFEKGDLIQVTLVGGRKMSGWIKAMSKDHQSIQLDISYEFPEMEGTVLVEARNVKSVAALEEIDPAEQTRRVAAAKARLEEQEKLRAAHELDLKKTEALEFVGTPETVEDPPFTVRTDAGTDVARAVLRTLKDAFAEYGRTFRGARDAEMKYRVLVYSSRDSYKTYYERVHGREWTDSNRAFYTYADQTLVLLDLRDDDALSTDVRHEAFHAFLHSFWVDAPAWFNEGLATYFESPGGANADRSKELSLLKEAGAFDPLKALRRVGYKDYAYETITVGQYRVPRYYAQGWSFVRYLMEDGDRRRVLTRYLGALQDGSSDDEAWTQSLREIDEAKLEADWERARRN